MALKSYVISSRGSGVKVTKIGGKSVSSSKKSSSKSSSSKKSSSKKSSSKKSSSKKSSSKTSSTPPPNISNPNYDSSGKLIKKTTSSTPPPNISNPNYDSSGKLIKSGSSSSGSSSSSSKKSSSKTSSTPPPNISNPNYDSSGKLITSKTTTAPAPKLNVAPLLETPKVQSVEVTPIIPPKVETTTAEEDKNIFGRFIDKVQESSLYQKIDNKIDDTKDKIEGTKIGNMISDASSKVEKVVDVVTPAPLKTFASKVSNVFSDDNKSASDITTQRKQELFNAQVNNLDKSITGRDYEKEKELNLEKEKLSKVISNQYPDMPGKVPGLELLNPALGIQGTKEQALTAYEEATELEQKKLDLQNKINSAPTPFEKYAFEKQLDDLNKKSTLDYSQLEVEKEKSKWFTSSQENARDKVDLSNKYEEQAKETSSNLNLIKLGASIASNDLNKQVSNYEEQVNKLNTQTALFNKKENEFKQLESKYETARLDFNKADEKYLELVEKYNKNPTSQNEANAIAAYTIATNKFDNVKDIYDDYKNYGNELQTEADKLTNRSQALDSVRQQLVGEQDKLSLAKTSYEDKVKQFNKLTDTYEDSLDNIKNRDWFETKKEKYQSELDYFKDVQAGGLFKSNAYDEETGRYINQVSMVGKVAGKTAARVGKFGIGVSEMARNIPEFVAVAPYREIKEDIAQGDFMPTDTLGQKIVTGVAPGVQAVQYWAKGIYDWDDPRNKDYNWKVNTNWKAVEGAVDTALLGVAAAKPIAAGAKQTGKTLTSQAFKSSLKAATSKGLGKWGKFLAKGVAGAVVGTEVYKGIGYAGATKSEKDFIERGNEFKGAMQAGIAAEQKASSLKLLPSMGEGGRGDVGTLLYQLPGGPLVRTGIQKVSTQGQYGKDESRTLEEFKKAVRKYYSDLGYKPDEVNIAVEAALQQRRAGMIGEVAGTVTANVASEIAGQSMLKDAGGALVAGKGTFWKPAIQIGKAGFVEGVAGELSTQLGRYEDVNTKDLLKTGAIGAVTAGLIGGTIAKTSGTKIGKTLQGGAYLADPYEKPGDVIAGMFEKGTAKAAKKTAGKSIAKVKVVSVVPSTTFSVTPGTSTLASTLSMTGTETAIKDVKGGPSVAITLKESAYKPTTFTSTKTSVKVPTNTDIFENLFRRSSASKTSFPSVGTPSTLTTSTKNIGLLTGVETPTWDGVTIIPPTSVQPSPRSSSETNINENVYVNTITNIFSNPIVPTSTSTKIKGVGGKGLNSAWLLAQRKKGAYGWNIDNKIRDFAGEFLKKQSKKSANKKLKALI